MARRRDRRVYLASHPVLFALMAATRGRPVRRLGSTVLVHGAKAYRTVLTRVPLDRTAAGTTGGAAGELAGAGALFDQDGDDHRGTRRNTAAMLGSVGVAKLRPLWMKVLDDRLPVLAAGGELDLVPLAAEIAGATAAELLGLDVDPVELASAAREAASAAARAHLPGPGRRRAETAAATASARLVKLIMRQRGDDTLQHDEAGLRSMIAVAAINTSVAAMPRAVAWACDDDLWEHAADPVLTDELLRVTAPTPLLPRVAAADAKIGGCPVRSGDRLLLIARHAADAHRRDPDVGVPAPARTAQLVFGIGPHACPGAGLARAQLADLLTALAPYRPVVVRARADRKAALPGWRSLTIKSRP
ncbi:cytochrome P450 [Actinoplanes sp. LDG1-01]|uniref:Cytochrome P450 n=1 Tax=Paractinoplanes lichenicola TaxID=2802976 RepID=A0ABS1VI84_9ACTN|nr:cytochrome P450 [Actinoplanes lichenicola]